MAETVITSELVFPTNNDVNGGSAGAGKNLSEQNFTLLLQQLLGENYVITGGNCSSGGGFTLNVQAGSAVIDGYYCSWPGFSHTMPAASIREVSVKLTKSAGLVTTLTFEDTASGVTPASCAHLYSVQTDGAGITALIDRRLMDRHKRFVHYERFTSSVGNWRAPAGITRAIVRYKGGGGGSGGGGGGGDCDATNNFAGECGYSGGLGSDGSEVCALVTVTPHTTYVITVGAGGTAGSAGAAGSGSAGGNGGAGGAGGSTQLGALASAASGGLGGTGGTGGQRGTSGLVRPRFQHALLNSMNEQNNISSVYGSRALARGLMGDGASMAGGDAQAGGVGFAGNGGVIEIWY